MTHVLRLPNIREYYLREKMLFNDHYCHRYLVNIRDNFYNAVTAKCHIYSLARRFCSPKYLRLPSKILRLLISAMIAFQLG